jgi:predicted nucleotidyltransferase
MSLFQDIAAGAQQRKLEFLVIGGLAVVFHGYSRDTADLDLLIREDGRAVWLDFLKGLGYVAFRDAGCFVQLSPPREGAWPVDLMLVKDSTFGPMLSAGLEVEMYGARVKVPALEHLLALKLHALKHSHMGRYAKDLLDVEGLVRANGLDLGTEKMRQLFLKYGTLSVYEQISRFTAGERP